MSILFVVSLVFAATIYSYTIYRIVENIKKLYYKIKCLTRDIVTISNSLKSYHEMYRGDIARPVVDTELQGELTLHHPLQDATTNATFVIKDRKRKRV